MPRTFFDLDLLANMVAKLGNIVGQFGRTFKQLVNKVVKLSTFYSIAAVSHFIRSSFRQLPVVVLIE